MLQMYFEQANHEQQCVKDAIASGTLLSLRGLNDT